MEIKNMAKPIFEFLFQILIGTIIFLIVAIPAVGLHYLVQWLESNNVDQVIIYGLVALQYSIFIMDVALLIIFLARSTIKFMRTELNAHNK